MSNYIKNILNQFKGPLLLIYLYMVLSHSLYLFEPYILGRMIDGLIIKEYTWLCVFLVVEIIANVFMYRRMVYDTKVYTEIYNVMIFDFLKKNKDNDISQKTARAEMANSIINFFENDIQYYIISVMSIVGTIFFILMEDVPTGLVVASCSIPILFIVKKLYKKIKQATVTGNNHYEQLVDSLNSEDYKITETFYKRRQRVLIMSSTLQGKNWFGLNTTKTIFLLLGLIMVTTNNAGITQGEAVAIYQYINNFLISLMSIPIGIESITRVKDIIKRIS